MPELISLYTGAGGLDLGFEEIFRKIDETIAVGGDFVVGSDGR